MGLFTEFEGSTLSEWEELVKDSLKGKPIESLEFKVGNLKFSPLFFEGRSSPSQLGKTLVDDIQLIDNQAQNVVPWIWIGQGTDPSSLPEIFRDLKQRSISQLGLEIGSFDGEVLAPILDSVGSSQISQVLFSLAGTPIKESKVFLEELIKSDFPKEKVSLLGADIISHMLTGGPIEDVVSWLGIVQKSFPGSKSILVDSNNLFDWKCEPYEELAILLESLCYGKDISEKMDRSFDWFLDQTSFRISPGPNLAIGISKLMTWSALSKGLSMELGGKGHPKLETIPSRYHQSLFDIENNLLRQGSEVISGFLAGYHSLHTFSYNERRDPYHYFGLWASLNLISLFKREGRLNRVAGPLSGSVALEEIAGRIAQRTWEMVRNFNSEDGSMSSDEWRSLIDDLAERKKVSGKDLSGIGKRIGENIFPNWKEKLPMKDLHYINTYLSKVPSISKGLDKIKILNFEKPPIGIAMYGDKSSRFSESNLVANLVSAIGIEPMVIDNPSEASVQEYSTLILVGELNSPSGIKFEKAGTMRVGVLGGVQDKSMGFQPDFVLDPGEGLLSLNEKLNQI